MQHSRYFQVGKYWYRFDLLGGICEMVWFSITWEIPYISQVRPYTSKGKNPSGNVSNLDLVILGWLEWDL